MYYKEMFEDPNFIANYYQKSLMVPTTSDFTGFKAPVSMTQQFNDVVSSSDSNQNGMLARSEAVDSNTCIASPIQLTSPMPTILPPNIQAGLSNPEADLRSNSAQPMFRLPPSSPTVRSSTDIVTPKMELVNAELWSAFHQLTNEMVVCRNGRKMFPKIELKLSGLTPNMGYFITLSMRLVDSNRYKFQAGSWSTAGHDNVPERSNLITHHEGLNGSGEFWMRNVISFDRVKLTNCPKAEGSMLSLSSMHKYQPVLQLYSTVPNTPPIVVLEPPILQFIAVTAYQNDAITELKIRFNPFAKGFREGSTRKRSRSPTTDDATNGVSPATAVPPPKRNQYLPSFNPAAAFFTSSIPMNAGFNFNPLAFQPMFGLNPQFMSNPNIFMQNPQNYSNMFNGLNNVPYPNYMWNNSFNGFPNFVNGPAGGFSPSALSAMLNSAPKIPPLPVPSTNGSSDDTSTTLSSSFTDNENSMVRDDYTE